MNGEEFQDAILEAVDIVVKSRIGSIGYTNSQVGVVLEDPRGYDAQVKIRDTVVSCIVPEHLHSWIQKDDIVIIKDLYNDGQKMVIDAKTGQLQSTPSLVFYDPEKDRLISGVDGIFDESGNKIAYGTVIKK